jgi:hypothetical protein
MVFATQRLPNTRYITRRIVTIPRQQLGKQLLSLQRMLTKIIPVTTWTTDEKLPFDKVSSIRGANTLFQGGEQKKGADQRRNVRAATKKPAVRGPTKLKNQLGSEGAVSLVRVIL